MPTTFENDSTPNEELFINVERDSTANGVTPYWKRFRHFKAATLEATKKLRKGWKDASVPEQEAKMKTWLEEVSAAYNMPLVNWMQDSGAGYGCYRPSNNTIYMAYPSIITLLHEFRHAMQHTLHCKQIGGIEEDARGWSLSLYHVLAPVTLRRLMTEGRVFHVQGML